MTRKIIASYFVSFLFLRSTASSFWSEENRFFFHWQRSDALAVLFALTITSGVLFLGYILLHRRGRTGTWLADFVFVAVTVFYLKVNLAESLVQYGITSAIVELLLKMAVLMVCLVYVFRRDLVFRCVKGIALILAPIVLVYAGVLVSGQPFRAVKETAMKCPLSDRRTGNHQKVCLVVFDEWSYRHSFIGNDVNPEFPGLVDLARTSFVFHNAYSPSAMTHKSLPAIITGDEPGELPRGTGFVQDISRLNNTGNIFTDMRARGYRTALYGNYLPYASLLDSSLDASVSFDLYKVLGNDISGVSALLLLDNLRIRTGFFLPPVRRAFSLAKNNYFASITDRIHAATINEIGYRSAAFVFAHQSVPHKPFIFNRSGFRENLSEPGQQGIEGYQNNLYVVDRIIGEMCRMISRDGLYDDVLLVVTSDHSYRGSDDMAADEGNLYVRHVPLLIRLPGQSQRVDVADKFFTRDLRRLISHYLDSDRSTVSFLNMIQCE